MNLYSVTFLRNGMLQRLNVRGDNKDEAWANVQNMFFQDDLALLKIYQIA